MIDINATYNIIRDNLFMKELPQNYPERIQKRINLIRLYTVMGDKKKYDRIRNLREDNDLSQTQIANHLFVAQRTYSGMKTGNTRSRQK